jgi:hypothetical protein
MFMPFADHGDARRVLTMARYFGKRLLAPVAAFGLAVLLAGCVVYPDDGLYAPGYAGYGGYSGYGSATVYVPGRAYEGYGHNRYRAPEHHHSSGWQGGFHHARDGGHAPPPGRRENLYGG